MDACSGYYSIVVLPKCRMSPLVNIRSDVIETIKSKGGGSSQKVERSN